MPTIEVVAKTYRPGLGTKLANAMLSALLRRGGGPPFMRLLTVEGRSTGQPRSTPVVPVEVDGGRWLVAPYGEVGWVRNVRAAGQVTLRRGKLSETLAATEVAPGDAVSVLRRYLAMKPTGRIVKAYFDVDPDASDDAFAREAPRHPVFELTPLPE
jgi:deazaflavin-dependent oxidoreductase (nitroreductase family)